MNLIRECEGAERIGISGHVRPDGDCVGACLALRLYLKKCLPTADIFVFLEKPSDDFCEIAGFEEIVILPSERDKDPGAGEDADPCADVFGEGKAADVFFVLDSMPDRIGAAQKCYQEATRKINIDHHISNPGCGDVSLVRPELGATCEVLYDLMEKEKIDREIAMALYIGIIHDTGVFQYSNTTPETLKRAAHLISFGFDFPRIIEETFYQRTYKQTRLLGHVLTEAVSLLDGSMAAGFVDRQVMDLYNAKSSDLEGIVNQLRNIKGVHCAAFLYEIAEGEYKVSLRSDNRVDVAKVAACYGGGGHVRAAGCTMKGSFAGCLKQIAALVEEQL